MVEAVEVVKGTLCAVEMEEVIVLLREFLLEQDLVEVFTFWYNPMPIFILGGGGGGGEGGQGGTGGFGGGGNFGIYTYNSPNGAIEQCKFVIGHAGSGGSNVEFILTLAKEEAEPLVELEENQEAKVMEQLLPIPEKCECTNLSASLMCSSGKGGDGAAGGNGKNGGRGRDGAPGLTYKIFPLTFNSTNLPIPPELMTVIENDQCTNSQVTIAKSTTNPWSISGGSLVNDVSPTNSSYTKALTAAFTFPSTGYFTVSMGSTLARWIAISFARSLPTARVPNVCENIRVVASVSPSQATMYEWLIYPSSGTPYNPTGNYSTSSTSISFSLPSGNYSSRLSIFDDCCGWSIPGT